MNNIEKYSLGVDVFAQIGIADDHRDYQNLLRQGQEHGLYTVLGAIARHEAESNVDGLTGLKNHVAFYSDLDALFEDTVKREKVSVIFIDLDDFKTINDTIGHLAGNDGLKYAARSVVVTLRTGEQMYRIGGDEFAVVSDGTIVRETRLSGVGEEEQAPNTENDAEGLTRRIIHAFEAATEIFRKDYGMRWELKASVGSASYKDDDTVRSIISRADQKMYDVKKRNKLE